MTRRYHTLRAPLAVAALLALLSAAAAPDAALAVSRVMSAAELSGGAELIVRGRVARVEGRWNGDRTAIHSDVAVAVDETLKGRLPASSRPREVVFSVLGGEVDGMRMVSSEDPHPAVGEEMVLFLRPSSSGAAAARSAAGAGAGALELVGQEQGAVAVRAGRVEMGGREVSMDELRAAIARSTK